MNRSNKYQIEIGFKTFIILIPIISSFINETFSKFSGEVYNRRKILIEWLFFRIIIVYPVIRK